MGFSLGTSVQQVFPFFRFKNLINCIILAFFCIPNYSILIYYRHALQEITLSFTLNYYNFPKSCCTSVNEVICHGIPDRRPLQEGDIVNSKKCALL